MDEFPKDIAAKRKLLLDRVEAIAPVLRAAGAKSEEEGTLAGEAVQALRDNGIFRLKLCTELGGAVVNAAVTLNGQYPVQVMAKLRDEPVITATLPVRSGACRSGTSPAPRPGCGRTWTSSPSPPRAGRGR